jgi:hypothetical protein
VLVWIRVTGDTWPTMVGEMNISDGSTVRAKLASGCISPAPPSADVGVGNSVRTRHGVAVHRKNGDLSLVAVPRNDKSGLVWDLHAHSGQAQQHPLLRPAHVRRLYAPASSALL